MKNIIRGALAASSLIASVGVAQAQATHPITNPVNQEFSQVTPTQGNWANSNPNNFTPCSSTSQNNCFQGIKNVPGPALASFSTSGTAPNNTELATVSVQSIYTLTGNVTPDCSFFGQGDRSIQLGQLGVRTGNNEAVGNMFNLRQAASVNINTSAAGCNTANTVTIAKNSDRGLVNAAATAFDGAQFQNNLPYSVEAKYTAPNTGLQGGQNGNLQTIAINSSSASGNYATGAWRSSFNIDVTTDVPTKGLISGTYEGTLTVTLAAAV
jgi:hypothetical protein